MGNQAPVVVIGNFDGVHRGHRSVLARAQDLAPGAPLVAVTFWPHPMSIVRPGYAPKLLCGLDRRRELLLAAGCSDVVVVEFTAEVSHWSPDEFVDRVLRPLHPTTIVVGENFRFGHKAAGTPDILADLGHGDFSVTTLSLESDEAGAVSSSRVRTALEEGDVALAEELLGRPFRFSGPVHRGDRRGRALGFPTANITVPAELAVPTDGVYAGRVAVAGGGDAAAAGAAWPAAISVGTNPTFDGIERRVESYVLDRDDLELYDKTLDVDFVQRLRGQVRFSDVDALIEQMHRDVDQARRLLS